MIFRWFGKVLKIYWAAIFADFVQNSTKILYYVYKVINVWLYHMMVYDETVCVLRKKYTFLHQMVYCLTQSKFKEIYIVLVYFV